MSIRERLAAVRGTRSNGDRVTAGDTVGLEGIMTENEEQTDETIAAAPPMEPETDWLSEPAE